MRLLNTETLEFKEFLGRDIPPYAILSHVWSSDEVSYSDFLAKQYTNDSYGYEKIIKLCEIARNGVMLSHPASSGMALKDVGDLTGSPNSQTLEWCWIDTCCIDKTSSAELTEAINSMYRWYEKSAACYIFMPDVHPWTEAYDMDETEPTLLDDFAPFSELQFMQSRWFKRGWTLQELIAPENRWFVNTAYEIFGFLGSGNVAAVPLARSIEQATGISYWVLGHGLKNDPYSSQSGPYNCVAERMSWIAQRETTREEDMSYCLLGIFNINMPLLYGEGAEKAFLRLQAEILSKSQDESLFAWDRNVVPRRGHAMESSYLKGLLAPSPESFRGCGTMRSTGWSAFSLYTVTQRGIELQVQIPRGLRPRHPYRTYFILPLDCYIPAASQDGNRQRRLYYQLIFRVYNGSLGDEVSELQLDRAKLAWIIARVQALPPSQIPAPAKALLRIQKECLGWIKPSSHDYVEQMPVEERRLYIVISDREVTWREWAFRCRAWFRKDKLEKIYVPQLNR